MKLDGRRVLVTGGAGFIGSHLVEALLGAGCEVLVLDNFSSGSRENLAHLSGAAGLRILEGDVRDKMLVEAATTGIDVVFHLAVECLRVSIRSPETNHEVNATGTLNLCLASLKNRVGRFVYCSSSEVYGTARVAPMDEAHPLLPMTVYGASKAAGEHYTLACHRTYGLGSLVVRPFNTYGPRSHFEGAYGEVIPKFVLRILAGSAPVIFGSGEQTRDFTYVTDTVQGLLAAAECDAMVGEAVNVARGEEISVNALAASVLRALGRTDLQPQREADRPGDVERHFADTAKARRLFGYSAGVGLDEGLRRYIAWFTSQGYAYAELLKRERVKNWE